MTFDRFAMNKQKSNDLVACASRDLIQIWNLDSNECVANLESNSKNIFCLENIDKNRFANGDGNGKIKIWDTKSFECLKTLEGHQAAVFCLKRLTRNRIASGTSKEIKIWSLKSGECLKTLYDISARNGIVCLPNGNIVARCFSDTFIKVWDIDKGECLKTFKDRSREDCCLFVMKNGQLASGSSDKTIRICDMESGECVMVLRGHSAPINQLQELESGELISCSSDGTIKVWDLCKKDSCIKTLVGHTSAVDSIRINRQRNSLVSSSRDGTIKTWDLRTGKCVNTCDCLSPPLWDFIFISQPNMFQKNYFNIVCILIFIVLAYIIYKNLEENVF